MVTGLTHLGRCLKVKHTYCHFDRHALNAPCPAYFLSLFGSSPSLRPEAGRHMSGRIAFAGLGRRTHSRSFKHRRVAPAGSLGEKEGSDQLLDPLPHIPAEVIAHIFNELEVQDLCHCAQVAKSWRAIVYERPEAGFQTCFLRDFGTAAARDYADRRTWRDKYIARSIDKVCHALRAKVTDLDELEETSATLERHLQHTLTQLNQLDRTVNHRRWDLNKLLADVAGKGSAHASSALGKEILAAARAQVELAAADTAAVGTPPQHGGGGRGARGGGSSSTSSRSSNEEEEQEEEEEEEPRVGRGVGAPATGQVRRPGGGQAGNSSCSSGTSRDGRSGRSSGSAWGGGKPGLAGQPAWHARLSIEVCSQLLEASRDVDFWLSSLREHKAARKALMDSLSFVGDNIKGLRAGVQELRSKRAALEAATTYRHTLRRA